MSATGNRLASESLSQDAGATLIEMLVVMGILGLVTALIFPAWTAPLRQVQLYEARAALISNLRTARASAVRGGAAVDLEMAEDNRGYGWGVSRVYLPGVVGIDSAPRDITFFADGSSTGAALTLTEHGRSTHIAVDPVTGLAAPG